MYENKVFYIVIAAHYIWQIKKNEILALIRKQTGKECTNRDFYNLLKTCYDHRKQFVYLHDQLNSDAVGHHYHDIPRRHLCTYLNQNRHDMQHDPNWIFFRFFAWMQNKYSRSRKKNNMRVSIFWNFSGKEKKLYNFSNRILMLHLNLG